MFGVLVFYYHARLGTDGLIYRTCFVVEEAISDLSESDGSVTMDFPRRLQNRGFECLYFCL
jgi:hypothetical protein